jgi:PD-(D/E)XK endonuclease
LLSVLTTNQKGAIAEAKIIAAAVAAHIGVARLVHDQRYDLIFDIEASLFRVQCKWARRVGDVVLARLYTSRRARNGMVVRRYEAGEVDVFGLYCSDNDTCYLLPADEVIQHRNVHLRLAPSRNNQGVGVRWARDYEFGATLERLLGPIAQLGEHLHGMQKAAGSSPAGSTVVEAKTERVVS